MSIGVIIITHGDFGEKMLSAAQEMIGKQDAVWAFSIFRGENLELIKENLKNIIENNKLKEWIILVDIPGGTPARICLSLFLKNDDVEIISGVNLSSLLKLFSCRDKLSVKEIAEQIIFDSHKSIQNLKSKFSEMKK